VTRRTLRTGAILVAACTLGAAIPVAFASGTSDGWSTPPANLSGNAAGNTADGPSVALSDATGDIAAVWLDQAVSGTSTTTYLDASSDLGSEFSAPQSLGFADPAAGDERDTPQVAEDADGDAVAVWLDGGELTYAFEKQPDTAFGSASVEQPVETGTYDSDPRVAMDSVGDAVAVWSQYDGTSGTWSAYYAASMASDDGTFEDPVQLASGLVTNPEPQIAVNQGDVAGYSGTATIVYIDQGAGLYASSLYLPDRDISANPFPTPYLVYSSADTLSQPVAAVATDGTSSFAWVDNGQVEVGQLVAANTAMAPGSPSYVVSGADETDPQIAMNQNAMNDDSVAVAFYNEADQSVVVSAQTSGDAADGNGWQVDNTGVVSEPTAVAQQPQLSVTGGDNSTVDVTLAWETGTGATADGIDEIASDANGSFGSATAQSVQSSLTTPPCDAATGSCLAMASDYNGDLAATWIQQDSSGTVQAMADCYDHGESSAPITTTTPATPSSGFDAASCFSPDTTATDTSPTTLATAPSTTATTNPTTPSTALTSSSSNAAPTTTSTPAPPVLGRTTDVSNTSGTVLVKLPGTNRFVPISSSQPTPLGAVINATHGTVTVTFVLPNGQKTTSTFWAGEFTLSQNRAGAVDATLVGGSFSGCPKLQEKSSRALAHAAKAKTKPKSKSAIVRSLWSKATGKYTTQGQYGAAAVLGTEWLTRDQCDGTYFQVTHTSGDPHGEIKVTVDHPHRHTVLLKQGHSLLAPAPGY
jgi:hypothetical protein